MLRSGLIFVLGKGGTFSFTLNRSTHARFDHNEHMIRKKKALFIYWVLG